MLDVLVVNVLAFWIFNIEIGFLRWHPRVINLFWLLVITLSLVTLDLVVIVLGKGNANFNMLREAGLRPLLFLLDLVVGLLISCDRFLHSRRCLLHEPFLALGQLLLQLLNHIL